MGKKKTSSRKVTPPSAELSRIIDDIECARRGQYYRPGGRVKRMRDVLPALFARKCYGQQASSAALADAWRIAAGEEVAAQTRVGAVRRGTLEVVVANSTISQELTFRKAQLVAELARRLPDHKITNVRFRTGIVQ